MGWTATRGDGVAPGRRGREAETSVSADQRRIARLLDGSRDIFLSVDADWRLTYLNRGVARLTDVEPDALLGLDLWTALPALAETSFAPRARAALAQGNADEFEFQHAPDIWFAVRLSAESDGLAVHLHEISARKLAEARLREQSETLAQVNRIGQLLAAELDLEKVVQAVTDAGTELTGARFGAFFYNVTDHAGERYTLYTISGVPREAFARFPMPRNTAIFAPTFRGEGVIRLDDVRQDPRYGQNSPYHGMPSGHLPVMSYLAVPVISNSGEVIGGLFFGHEQAGVFTEREEGIVVGLAAHAAIAMDNARLFKAAQEARAQAEISEQRYRILAEIIPQMVWTARPDGSVDYVNQRWRAYTGMTFEQSLNWGWQHSLHPADLQPCLDAWHGAIQTGEVFEIEYRLRRAEDETYRWHLSRAVPVRDEAGQIVRWFGTTTDIDDQKRAQEALGFLAEASTAFNASLDYDTTLATVARQALPVLADCCVIETLGEGDDQPEKIVVADVDADRADVTRAARLAEPLDIAGDAALTVALRAGQPAFIPHLDERAAGESALARQLRRLGFTALIVAPLTTGRRHLGVMSLMLAQRDITYTTADLALAADLAHRASLALENARLYRETREALRARDQFLSIASHELKTPVTTIKGSAQLLLRGQERGQVTPERLARSLAMINDSANRLTTLTDDLLDIARIRGGHLSLRLQPLDLADLTRTVVGRYIDQLDRRFQLRVDLPEIACLARGDADRIDQVLTNLIDNAIKYSPDGGTIEVRLWHDGEGLCLTVRDEGIGLPPGTETTIFEPFGRATNAAERNLPGMGLGLYICRNIIERHSGRIWAESGGDGRGTTMHVWLPLNPPQL